MQEVERTNKDRSNRDRILQYAHKLYFNGTRKKFDLKHWYKMLRDQPELKKICDPPKSRSSNPKSEEARDKGMDGSDRPEGREATQKKDKEKVNKTIIEFMISHFKEFSTNSTQKMQIFKDLVTIVGEKVTAAKDTVHIRNEHKQYKETNTQLKLRK